MGFNIQYRNANLFALIKRYLKNIIVILIVLLLFVNKKSYSIRFGIIEPIKKKFEKVKEEVLRKRIALGEDYASISISDASQNEGDSGTVELIFSVEIDVSDPEKEITSTLGAKEAVFNFPEGFVNPNDVVIMPNPGYPPYERGTLFAEGKPYFYPLLKENDFWTS